MPKRKRKPNQSPETDDNTTNENSLNALQCFICKKEFAKDAELSNHVADVHGPRFNCQCAHCTGKRRHDSARLAEEISLKDNNVDVKTFKCIVCQYQVFLLCKCLSHIQTAHNTVSVQKQYECMKCNIGFEQCQDLHKHILQDHPHAQKIARCGFSHCKKCFSNATLLQTHLKQNHKITKPFELLSNIKGVPFNPNATSKPTSSASSTSSASGSASTSAWLAPDPPSPPPPEESKTSVDPDLTCKICNKAHKSQTAYNNHMLVFHKEKIKSQPVKKRRRNNDDDSDVSSDMTSEDSDWEQSYLKPSRSSRKTRSASKKVSSDSETAAEQNTDKQVEASPVSSEAPGNSADQKVAEPEKEPEPPAAKASTVQNTKHEDHGQNAGEQDDCRDCLACKQAKKLAAPPPNQIPTIKIKQEPLDPDENPMPVISNVFSMTSSGAENPPSGYENQKSFSVPYHSPSGSGYNQHESSDERPQSTASSLHNGSNFGPASGSPPLNTSPSTGWQPRATTPNNQAAMQGDLCVSCHAQKPNQNKCVHCGIIFLEPTMHMIHMLWHGEKHPFQCHTCGVICQDKYSFTTHIFKAQHLNPH